MFGWLCDKMHPKKAWAIGQAMEACAALILININADSPVIFIWVFALLLGLGMGAWLPTLSLLTSTMAGVLGEVPSGVALYSPARRRLRNSNPVPVQCTPS